jgi:BASS family bile acid:Na+ symporter
MLRLVMAIAMCGQYNATRRRPNIRGMDKTSRRSDDGIGWTRSRTCIDKNPAVTVSEGVVTAQEALSLGLQGSIMLTVVGFGLGATFEEATYLFRHPKLLLRCVLSMCVVVPIIFIAASRTFDLPIEVRGALVAISISPVPPILQKKQLGAGGRMEFVTGLLVAMSALAIVLVPVWVWIIDQAFDRQGHMDTLAVAKIMLTTVFVPLTLGLLIRRAVPAAQRASSAVMGIAGVALVVVVAVLIWGVWPQMRVFIGNGAVLLIVVLVVLGLVVGHVLGGPGEGNRTALAMATSSRHPAVALAAATSGTLTEAKTELAVILLYLLVATVVTIFYLGWRHRVVKMAS